MTAAGYRTIIQIATSSGGADTEDVLYALASDGTVWRLIVTMKDMEWEPVPRLPQPRPPR